MKKFVVVAFILMNYAFAKAGTHCTVFFQKYVSHQVKSGETVYSIAKKYGLTEKEITTLNPDAKTAVYEGLVLILPAKVSKPTVTKAENSNNTVAQEDFKFKTHKVKRKETLYSISKKYGVPQDVIKRYNKRLYSEVLRKGDKIRVPTDYKEAIAQNNTNSSASSNQNTSSGMVIHKVVAKETKYGIARKYGVSIEELVRLNPAIRDGLKEGAELTVPERSEAKSVIIDDKKFSFYEVQKGNTMYSLLRLLKIEADELLALNPGLEDGLKEGMILKVPKGSTGAIASSDVERAGEVFNTSVKVSSIKKGSLLDSLSDYTVKKVAVMLPFDLNGVSLEDATANEALLSGSRVLRITLDLYSGMLMAVEDAKKIGISSEISTYDTAYNSKDGASTNARKVEKLIQENDLSQVDALIGPLLGVNINRAASLLRGRNIPIISPMSYKVNESNNVFISRPDDTLLRGNLLRYVKERGVGKNIVIIADEKNQASKAKIKAIFPNAKTVAPRKGDNGYFLYPDDIPSKMDPLLENWVFLETNDVPLISNVTTSLNAQVGQKKVTLFTTNRGNAYDSDEIQHVHLSNLSFHFASVDREYKYSKQKAFIDSYQDMYGITPSNYAIRGYDLMYDTLLRLTYASNLYKAAATGIETEYIENKFRYGIRKNGGFYNDSIFILKYTEDLTLEEVPFD